MSSGPNGREGRGEPFSLTQSAQGALRLFQSAEHGDLKGLFFRRRFLTETTASRKEEVLVNFSDGSAALSLSPAGRGSAVFANFPATPDGGNLVGSPLFAPLLHELMRALRRTGDADVNAPGREWYIDVSGVEQSAPADVAYTVVAPDGNPMEAVVVTRGRTVRLALPPVRLPGHYLVRLGQTLSDIGVVNVHPDETDTRQMIVTDLAEERGAARAAVTVLNDEGDVVSAGKSRALWPQLVALVALFLGAEMFLLAVWRHVPQRAVRPAMSGRTRQ
jgi:hypothetical protein